jgi:cell fate (sporulation/competence/biofilm development) regulator YlbF (YheA/YmcA/DUF963 family)
MSHGHKEIWCKTCKRKVGGCRCPELNKLIEWIEACDDCIAKQQHVETESEAKERISKQLGTEILNLQTQGAKPDEIAKIIFATLVDSRYKIEQYTKGSSSIENIVKEVQKRLHNPTSINANVNERR